MDGAKSGLGPGQKAGGDDKRRPGRQMRRPEGGVMDGRIGQVGAQHGESHRRQPRGRPRLRHDLMPPGAQVKGDVPADEPVGADDQHLHG
jgi:hypothetical protein